MLCGAYCDDVGAGVVTFPLQLPLTTYASGGKN